MGTQSTWGLPIQTKQNAVIKCEKHIILELSNGDFEREG